jgi:hypothetical protein
VGAAKVQKIGICLQSLAIVGLESNSVQVHALRLVEAALMHIENQSESAEARVFYRQSFQQVHLAERLRGQSNDLRQRKDGADLCATHGLRLRLGWREVRRHRRRLRHALDERRVRVYRLHLDGVRRYRGNVRLAQRR